MKYELLWKDKDKMLEELESLKTSNDFKKYRCITNNSSVNFLYKSDNLNVLKHLQKDYQGKIKMIYIDPPYNTGKGFMYKDTFKQKGDNEKHSSWLNFMYPRLSLAKNILRDDGVIFMSIDDNEQAQLKLLFDEIFGERNFIANLCIIDNLKGNNNTEGFSQTSEYCLVYAKNKSLIQLGEINIDEEDDDFKKWHIDEKGYWKEGRNIKGTGENAPREKRPTMFYPIYLSDNLEISLEKSDYFHIEVLPINDGKEMCWNWGKETLEQNKNELIVKITRDGYNLHKKQRPSIGDLPSRKLKTSCYSPKYSTTVSSNTIKKIFGNNNVFNYTKSIYLLKDLIQVSSDKDSIILDFFAGSGTTGHAVLELNAEDNGNRRFILVQLPESIDEKKSKNAYDFVKNTLGIDEPKISDITQERLIRASKQVEEKYPEYKGDLGFQVFVEDNEL